MKIFLLALLFAIISWPALAAQRFGPHINGRIYPGIYVGKFYVGTDPDLNIRFELRRDYGRLSAPK